MGIRTPAVRLSGPRSRKPSPLRGGKGRDRLHGGKGRNKCTIDSVDLSVARGCASITVAPGGSGPGGGPGSGGPGSGGPSGGLALATATGLQRSSALPTCSYTLNGTGAKSGFGTISGGGGVMTVGGSASILRVTIGSDYLDVPVDCVTPA